MPSRREHIVCRKGLGGLALRAQGGLIVAPAGTTAKPNNGPRKGPVAGM